MNILTDRLIDETHTECVERVRRSQRYVFKPQPPDLDAHVTAWRIAMWDRIEQLAWMRRQERALYV